MTDRTARGNASSKATEPSQAQDNPGELAGSAIAGTRRAEREEVIDAARKIDSETFATETRDGRPGKWEHALDLPLAVALDIIDEHGLPDEISGAAARHGYAWRVNRFVGVVDPQGFVYVEDYPTRERANERLRDFDVPIDDEESSREPADSIQRPR